MHGKGEIHYKQFGDFYKGDFSKGLIEGHGEYVWKNKETYTGLFLKGKMNGFGIYKWPSGREFHGNYANNLKDGNGEFRWKSGKILICTYDKGKPIGNGVLTDTKANVQKTISQDEIKTVLKNEKKLNMEFSYLEYINSDEDNNNNLVYDLCSIDSNINKASKKT